MGLWLTISFSFSLTIIFSSLPGCEQIWKQDFYIEEISRRYTASQVAQWWRVCLPMQETLETWVRSLQWEDPLEEEMATHSSVLTWRIPWTEEPVRLQSMGLQRVGHNWACTHVYTASNTKYYNFTNAIKQMTSKVSFKNKSKGRRGKSPMIDEFPNFKASKLCGNESSHSWAADFHDDRSPSLLVTGFPTRPLSSICRC